MCLNEKRQDHWQQVLDNGRRLLDRAPRVLDHWVVSRASVRYLNLISKNPKAFGYSPKRVLDHWVVSRGSVRYLNLNSKNPKAF